MQKIKIAGPFTILLTGVVILFLAGCSQKKFTKEISDNLKSYIDTLTHQSLLYFNYQLYNPLKIKMIYEGNGKLPSAKWTVTDNIVHMITAIKNATQDGLNPYDYHLAEIIKLTENKGGSERDKSKKIALTDILLSDAFVLLATHLAVGKTDPDSIYPQWNITRRSISKDLVNFIDSSLKSNNIAGSLRSLNPRHTDYDNLKKALAKYLQIEANGGWPLFRTDLRKLEIGLRHPDVSLLRKRLAITQGNIPYTPEDENLFDKALLDQVILFQRRNSLYPDGVVGSTTIEALNIPVRDRIETLRVNLERWRWISDDLGKTYIRVNIADFSLQVFENNRQVLQSLAVVGQPFRQTPVFSSTLKYLVLNPDWEIPPDILKKEIIPEIIKNPPYLNENNMKIIRVDGTEVDPLSIRWNRAVEENFPYMIRQEPGAQNALGRIAFIFPNQYYVYIHDTPFPYLFSETNRAFSHGCIRINKAFELAEYLMRKNPGWDSTLLKAAIDGGTKQIIILKQPVPVHILYLTAWATDEGLAYFDKDIYNRDRWLIDALDKRPPGHNKELHESQLIREPESNKPGNSLKNSDKP